MEAGEWPPVANPQRQGNNTSARSPPHRRQGYDLASFKRAGGRRQQRCELYSCRQAGGLGVDSGGLLQNSSKFSSPVGLGTAGIVRKTAVKLALSCCFLLQPPLFLRAKENKKKPLSGRSSAAKLHNGEHMLGSRFAPLELLQNSSRASSKDGGRRNFRQTLNREKTLCCGDH